MRVRARANCQSRARERKSWVARTLVAANLSSARCAGVPNTPNPPNVKRLPGSRIMTQTVLLAHTRRARAARTCDQAACAARFCGRGRQFHVWTLPRVQGFLMASWLGAIKRHDPDCPRPRCLLFRFLTCRPYWTLVDTPSAGFVGIYRTRRKTVWFLNEGL